jgi:hypothetical protein
MIFKRCGRFVSLSYLEGKKSVDANDFVDSMHELQEHVKKKL